MKFELQIQCAERGRDGPDSRLLHARWWTSLNGADDDQPERMVKTKRVSGAYVRAK